MRYRLLSWAVMLVLVAPAAARAQNREHLQLEADLRILQEQIGRLQMELAWLKKKVAQVE